MPATTLRNVPQAVRGELAGRAGRAGRSLQEYLLAVLTQMSRTPDIADIVARIEERKRSSTVQVSVADILAHRDADRR
ncbi:hypothetical protein [Tsukamurella soli]|uniref:Toxin-antitoxin system n=1 Tax=Tsukamurella soli TaxID=644556 RepID=A0ABP8J3H1_9ACTN